jgi:hypothetical protein
LDPFKLQLINESIETLAVDDLPRVPIKNIHILQKDGREFDIEACISIVNKYRTSVEAIVIENRVMGFYEMKRLLENMENLQKLTLNDVCLFSDNINHLQLPKLTSLSISSHARPAINPSHEILRAFKCNSSIETLRISVPTYCEINRTLYGFIETLPKIKHLKLEGQNWLPTDLPLNLETLHLHSLNTDDNVKFLLNQTELKELRLKWLPRVNTAAFVRTVYEHLDTFYLEDALLILNFQPQHVEKTLCIPWEAGLEILKRGRCEWNL